MHITRKSVVIKVVAIVLLVVMLCPAEVFAVESRASYYLSSYSAYVYRAGWAKIQVWFEVDGVEYMDEIGSLQIQLYESTDNENWTWIKTYGYSDNEGMLAYNDYSHSGHIEYKGTLGRYYKANVCVWAGKDGDGDTRYFWTNSEKATLFAE